MHRKPALSEAHQMYLKTLYDVRGRHDASRVRDVADELGVSPGTVSAVLKKLEHLQLVEHERYGAVSLTASGSRVAECLHRRFEILRDVLVEIFGVAPDVAVVDACMMEHAVSPTTVAGMRDLLTRVRAGKVALPKRKPRAPAGDLCAQCVAHGVCAAEAATQGVANAER